MFTVFSGVFRGVRQQVTSPNNVSTANKDVLDDDGVFRGVRQQNEGFYWWNDEFWWYDDRIPLFAWDDQLFCCAMVELLNRLTSLK